LGINNVQVVELDPLLGQDHLSHGLLQDHGVDLAFLEQGPSGTEGPIEGGGLGAFLLREILVAAAHGQPIGLTDRGAGDDLNGKVKVMDHAIENDELLYVLLPEVDAVGLNDVEELGDHGTDAAEMSAAPGHAAEPLGEAAHEDAGHGGLGVHLFRLRREDGISPRFVGRRHIGLQAPRVGVEVLTGPKLGRIDVDADHGELIFITAAFDQA
jgi:hypothetical protein